MDAPTTERRDESNFQTWPMDQLGIPSEGPITKWLWHGLLARRNITLLTSQWKAGKTTLLTGLLQRLEMGGRFLDRAVTPAKVLVVSEEPRETWAERLDRMPLGPHCQLMPRPFRCRPTPRQWNDLVDYAANLVASNQLDLLAIDPLAKFFPGSTESDMNAMLEMLDPLRRLTDGNAGVMMTHHPRKKHSEEGCSARGHGGLLAAVDIIAELSGNSKLRTEERRRRLFAISRYADTPRQIYYDWNPKTGAFNTLADLYSKRFQENWPVIEAILKKRMEAATHLELLLDWPLEQEQPTAHTLYNWLNRAFDEKLLRREGAGRKKDPYRFRLENEEDEYRDRGEIPPDPLYRRFLRDQRKASK